MNYYEVMTKANARSAALNREAERGRLAHDLSDERRLLVSVRVEVNLGRLAHWRLQWGNSGETKVSYDPIPNCG
jgi:hypothetical protein